MKGKIFEIKRFAVHDGDGIRTTVFLKGCPLKCVWCHNPEGISRKNQLAFYSHKCISCGECAAVCPTEAHKIADGIHTFDRGLCIGCGRCAEVCLGEALTLYGKEIESEELVKILLEDREFYENSGGGVTLSGGECLMQADFCRELLGKLKDSGINTAVDTCGFVNKTELDKVIPYTDVFLYDIKAINADTHKKCTGSDNSPIIDNIRYLSERGARIEVRIPFVPGYNDKEITDIAKLLSEIKTLVKVRMLPYHNYAGSKYASLGMKNESPKRIPTEEELEGAKSILREYGITVQD